MMMEVMMVTTVDGGDGGDGDGDGDDDVDGHINHSIINPAATSTAATSSPINVEQRHSKE